MFNNLPVWVSENMQNCKKSIRITIDQWKIQIGNMDSLEMVIKISGSLSSEFKTSELAPGPLL